MKLERHTEFGVEHSDGAVTGGFLSEGAAAHHMNNLLGQVERGQRRPVKVVERHMIVGVGKWGEVER